ncbi:MAG TPA: tetratricopeptide repeat protein [Gemmataceae bacterium]|nr:tetratricopeptide repeat protein [Gemmataceae bacterium]
MHRTMLLAALAAMITGLHAQATPAPGDDPKPPASESPAAVLDLVSQAQAKSTAQEWKEAAALWEQVVRLNPVRPEYWFALGEARHRAADYRGAIPAYERAAELGAPLMGAYVSVYRIAHCQARAGEKELAIRALERALDLGYPSLERPAAEPDLASLRDDPRFKKMLGLADVSKMSREEGWRYDLSLLAGEVRRKGFNPRLSVHRPVTLEQFDAKVRELHDAIPKLTDGQITLALIKLMVFLEDGHSAVWDVGENPLFRAALPLRFFWFEEGLHVTAADPKYKDLLGARVVAFDGKPAEDVLKAMEPYISRDRGNPMTAKLGLPYRVRMLAVLHAAGLVKAPDRVTLTVRDLSGSTRDVEVAADAKEPNIWNTLPAPDSWVTFTSTLDRPPLYVRHMDRAQWFEYLPDRKAVYFQFNKVLDDEKELLARFTERLIKFLDENDVDRLVIDLRWNNGGNTFLGQPLLLGLIANKKVNQRGKLFVIIGRRTYSAAQNMATYFERFTNATFVGEPTGSSPNAIGEEDPVTLPYSKIMANVSHLYWQGSWPQDQRIWLAPQVYVAPTFADFRAGRDAALEAILAHRAP